MTVSVSHIPGICDYNQFVFITTVKQLKKMHKMNKWDRKRAEKKNKEDHAKGLIDESTSDALLLTPLMLACKAGNVKIAKMLIDNGSVLVLFQHHHSVSTLISLLVLSMSMCICHAQYFSTYVSTHPKQS